MADELIPAINAVVQRLVELAARDDDLRARLRDLARAALVEAIGGRQVGAPEASREAGAAEEAAVPLGVEPEPAEAPKPPDGRASGPTPGPPPEPLRELTIGQAAPQPTIELPHRYKVESAIDDDELPWIAARCGLKAEGARWAARRRRRIEEGTDFEAEILPGDRDLIERARRLPDCYLWMNSRDFVPPANLATLEDLARGFEAVARAVSLVQAAQEDVEGGQAYFAEALDLLAEAQSALRVTVERVGGPRDPDQFRTYNWLRETTSRQRIFIERYMRISDPADPGRLDDLNARLDRLGESIRRSRARDRHQKRGLGRVQYHAKIILENKDTGRDTSHDWKTIAATVDEMIGEGLPTSSTELRESLLPVIDEMPDLGELPQGFRRVLEEIDRYLASRPTAPEEPVSDRISAQVEQVARLLAGKSIVLIGGHCRNHARRALEAAFRLKDVIWIETREHQSIESFEADVARPDVALVLLAIRWSSHAFGDVKVFCDRHDKPLVRLPGGYNPNQVAAQILGQVSDRLGGNH